MVHADNSAGIESFPESGPFNGARVGLLQFGVRPRPGSFLANTYTEPVLSFHSRIGLVKDLPEVSNHLAEVISAANRVSSITAELLAFSHRGPLSLKPMSLDKAITGVDTIIKETLPANVTLRLDTSAADCKVSVDPLQLEQALLHIAINAAEAMSEGGEITLSTAPARLSKSERKKLQGEIHEKDRHKGAFAVLSVTDTGCGMSKAVTGQIFEPFYTTKTHKHNAGLGLSTVYRIVDQHNGCITVESRPNKGTTVNIFLPIVD